MYRSTIHKDEAGVKPRSLDLFLPYDHTIVKAQKRGLQIFKSSVVSHFLVGNILSPCKLRILAILYRDD